MTPTQKKLIKSLQDNPRNSIASFLDLPDKKVRYEVMCWKGKKWNLSYPNPRTIESLIKKGILVRTNGAGLFVNYSELED